jgi:hypothetical protein
VRTALFVLAGLVGAAVPGAGAAQSLSGRVVDPEGRGVPAVDLSLVAISVADSVSRRLWYARSDDGGRFRFDGPADGGWILVTEATGYARFSSRPLLLRADDPLELRVTMHPDPVDLEPVVVTASTRPWWEVLEPPGLWGFYDRMERGRASGFGRFYSGAEIRAWRGAPVARALAAVVPYLQSAEAPGLPGQYSIRGPGDCRPRVFVDGRPVETIVRGAGGRVVEEVPLDMIVDSFGLYAVEVYRGMTEAPIELTSARDGLDDGRDRCSIVGLWTRRR